MEALRQHEHPFETVKRVGHRIADAFVIRGWSELPVAESAKPIAGIIEYPHRLKLCDPPELGWQTDVPPKPDHPRAA